GGVGILLGIFLVDLGFFEGAFGLRRPVAAGLVVDEVEGGEFGPLGVGELLHHEPHAFLVDLRVHVWVGGLRGWAGAGVEFLDLPLYVGGAIEGFASDR